MKFTTRTLPATVVVALLVLHATPLARVQVPAPATTQVQGPAGPLFTLSVEKQDAVALLRQLATDAGVSLAFVGDVAGVVTVALRDANVDQAITLVTRAAGLFVQKADGAYLIGKEKFEPLSGAEGRTTAVYRVQHVRADKLGDSLRAIFEGDQLRVILGPDAFASPRLEASSTAGKSSGQEVGTLTGEVGANDGVNELILSGEASLVAAALDLCRQMDHRRRQVRLNVRITDIDADSLREFGVKWNASVDLKAREQPTQSVDPPLQSTFLFGTFLRDPIMIDAAVTALETQGRSTMLASPSILLLDGERGFILIGERRLFPKLTGYSQAMTPIYDQSEVRVGIYLQLAVDMTDDDDMILTLYPQVSAVTGALTVGDSIYPQVSTREQQTTVRARSGQTIIIGGLLKEGEVNSLRGVPGLSKIPLLGELFKFRSKTKVKSELVIMITPEIDQTGTSRH